MPGISLGGVDWTYDSVGGSGIVQSPGASEALVTVPSAQLPSGYYHGQYAVGIAKLAGGASALLTDLLNFRMVIGGQDPIQLAAFGEGVIAIADAYATLNGTQSITIRTESAGTVGAIYIARIILTRLRGF